MSNRTYIGPFGRILPLPDDSEPEQSPSLVADEERGGLHLPPPPLNFGSDPSMGFTDPTRYNTISHSRRIHDQRFSTGETWRPPSGDILPPVRQLLTPASHPSEPSSPYSSQHSVFSSQRRSSPTSSRNNSVPEEASEILSRPQRQLSSETTNAMQIQNESPYSGCQPFAHYQGSSLELSPVRQATHHYSVYDGEPSSRSYQPYYSFAQRLIPPSPSVSQYPDYLTEHRPPMLGPIEYLKTASRGINMLQSIEPPSMPSQPLPSNTAKPALRVIREDVLPDEGPVWVYEDGSTCPKEIDGEEVHAEWGLTKAGKPRKRLAIACTSCREKKIKCDPAEPKCVQCEKNNRVCKFATA